MSFGVIEGSMGPSGVVRVKSFILSVPVCVEGTPWIVSTSADAMFMVMLAMLELGALEYKEPV